MRSPLVLAILAALPLASPAVEIDGRLEPGEWADARHVTGFRLTQPLSRQPAPYPTEAWIKATPEGLAVAFRSLQPPGVERRRQRTQRDQGGALDRVNLYVDFDGDGRVGYNFMVTLAGGIEDGTITGENRFNNDWDGTWRHAATEDEAGWSAEMLIPWHVAPMREAAGGTRTIAVLLDRVVGSTGERMAWPAVAHSEPRYLSAFEKIEVPAYSQSLLAVTPYVVGVHDAVRGAAEFDAGGDLFWKPNGQFQLSATLNPDFGQVESDELVVNFSAVETFVSDKRPFFTENQSFFDVPFGSPNSSNRLVYTRRVGGVRDDGDGAADVLAAAKLNGSLGAWNYGLFLAAEADDAGRDFQAARLTRDFPTQGIGLLATRVAHPWLDRTASVGALEHRWTPTADLTVRSVVVGSDVEQQGRATRDSGAQVRIDQALGGGWRQQLYAVHLGDSLQLNDFGYLERNDFNYARYELARRVTSLPDTSPFASHDWRVAASRRMNDHGLLIADAWALNRSSDRRDGGSQFFEVSGWSAGHDDRITRGHGVVRVPSRLYLSAERNLPRRGQWGVYGSARYAAEGLGGWREGAVSTSLEATWFASDSATVGLGIEARHAPDWLLWRPDATGKDSLATFRADQLRLALGATWLIDQRQDLRLKLEAIGLDARAERSYALAADGIPVPVGRRHEDFALRSMGLQLRYRYELASLSYLYVAYVRGGEAFESAPDGRFGATDQLGSAFSLRDSEQLLVKLSYRFEI